MNKKYIFAIIGATGNVGREIIKYLDQKLSSYVKEVIAVGSDRSIGKEVSFGDNNIKVTKIDDIDFLQIDIAFFCAGNTVSRKYAKLAVEQNCIVIDKSSFFRMNQDVPLIVPEVNIHNLKDFKSGIIASPNCCAIPISVALKPLDNVAKIKRIVASTYQSVSGAGKAAMDELYMQTKAKFIFEDIKPKAFKHQIAFNLIPQIGDFHKDGSTEEEYKISQELKKLMGNHIKSSLTCVRVPIFVSHSISLNVEFENELNAEEAEEILREADGVNVFGLKNTTQYLTPVEVVEDDEVYIARIRNDTTSTNSLNMWISTDNLRKGAALNAIQIAQEIIRLKR